MNEIQYLSLDHQHLVHPYTSMTDPLPNFLVHSASGVEIELADGRRLVDGMSSWWAAIHGYNHPDLNAAITGQCQRMAHVMFGGLTHEPAIELAKELVDLAPGNPEKVFFSDSGSVAVEAAIKMALQYWRSRGETQRSRLLSLRRGYHGDTFAAMSVCDPVNGMHSLFSDNLVRQHFANAPQSRFGQHLDPSDIEHFRRQIERHHKELAAVILEPIVQGAGGMFFYAPEYLRQVRQLCDQYDILLIADEIATGFGRTGRLFACEHAGIAPDILCLGKALTGGYMTLAATMATRQVAEGISAEGHSFMQGPTFMANPLACAVSLASIRLLLESDWSSRVAGIEQQLHEELSACREMPAVTDVRVLGAIGVVELKEAVDMRIVQPRLVEKGVWIRPFGRLLYIMPAYIMPPGALRRLTGAMVELAEELSVQGI